MVDSVFGSINIEINPTAECVAIFFRWDHKNNPHPWLKIKPNEQVTVIIHSSLFILHYSLSSMTHRVGVTIGVVGGLLSLFLCTFLYLMLL